MQNNSHYKNFQSCSIDEWNADFRCNGRNFELFCCWTIWTVALFLDWWWNYFRGEFKHLDDCTLGWWGVWKLEFNKNHVRVCESIYISAYICLCLCIKFSIHVIQHQVTLRDLLFFIALMHKWVNYLFFFERLCAAPTVTHPRDPPLHANCWPLTLFPSSASLLSSCAPVICKRMEERLRGRRMKEEIKHMAVWNKRRNPIKDRSRREMYMMIAAPKANCGTGSETCLCIAGKENKSPGRCRDCSAAPWIIGW